MRCKCPDETLALKLSSSRRKRENHEPRRCFLRINQLSTRLRGAAGGGKEAREGARWFSVNQSRRSEGAHAQKNPQTHSRTQETRLIRSLQASQVPSRSGLSTTLVSSRDQPCPGRGGPRFTSGLSVLGGRAPTWHWLCNSTGPVEPGPGLNSRVRGQPNHFQRFLIQGTRSK